MLLQYFVYQVAGSRYLTLIVCRNAFGMEHPAGNCVPEDQDRIKMLKLRGKLEFRGHAYFQAAWLGALFKLLSGSVPLAV